MITEVSLPRPGYLAIGRIAGAHGIRGEVKVEVLTDYPERFAPGCTMYLGNTAADEQVCIAHVVSSRQHKGRMLVKLEGIDDRTAAELLRDYYLMIPEDQAMPLSEHENYVHDLIGLEVQTVAGERLGRLTEVLFTPANDVYVVAGSAGEILLPALREVVLAVNLAAGTMIVDLPAGLRDE